MPTLERESKQDVVVVGVYRAQGQVITGECTHPEEQGVEESVR